MTDVARDRGAAVAGESLPPGQHVDGTWPVMHYGSIPTFRPDSWDLSVLGATEDGGSTRWAYADLAELPQTTITADFHCVTGCSVRGLRWTGVAAAELLALAPPAPEVGHVLVWAERGYSANLRVGDFRRALFAHSVDGEQLRPERGWPLRLVVPHRYGWKGPKWVRGVEYLIGDRRGFWEERGYHNVGDPWLEQRYSYQEQSGDGPPLAQRAAAGDDAAG